MITQAENREMKTVIVAAQRQKFNFIASSGIRRSNEIQSPLSGTILATAAQFCTKPRKLTSHLQHGR
jgi:hypothetical protein